MSDLLQQIQDQAAAKRAEAAENYRTILLRADNPRPGDVERLIAAMQELDFAPDRLESDLRVLREAAALELKAAEADADLDAAVEDASAACQAYRSETERIARERKREGDELWSQFTALQHRQSTAREAKRELVALRRRHWAIFGGPPPIPEPDAKPTMLVSAPIGQPPKAENVVTPVHTPRLSDDGRMTFGPVSSPLGSPTAATAVAELPTPAGGTEDGPDDWSEGPDEL